MSKILRRGWGKWIVAGAAVVLWTLPASAQFTSSSGGGSSGSYSGGGAKTGGGSSGGGMGSSGSSSSGSGTVFGSGGSGGANSKSSSSATYSVPTTDPFSPYYSSPLGAGWGPNVTLQAQNGLSFDTGGSKSTTLVTGRGTFGAPLVAATTSKTGGYGGGGGGGSNLNNVGFNTIGVKRNPQYITTLDFDRPAPMPKTQVRANLQAVLAQSPALQNKGLNVLLDGQTVVLQGTVATAKDRQLAEGLLRLTPGVDDVRNEIVVVGNGNGQ
jgi:hypothetical protein